MAVTPQFKHTLTHTYVSCVYTHTHAHRCTHTHTGRGNSKQSCLQETQHQYSPCSLTGGAPGASTNASSSSSWRDYTDTCPAEGVSNLHTRLGNFMHWSHTDRIRNDDSLGCVCGIFPLSSTRTHMCMCVCVCVCVYLYKHSCIPPYKHTHKHTYMDVWTKTHPYIQINR